MSSLLQTSCGYLLQELQMIWDEVGEDEFEREKVLLDLEHECLDVYRRKVDAANISRSRLHQQLAEAEAEFTHLLLSLGEPSLPGRPEKMVGSLKEQLESITPALREMRLRKEERSNQFRAVQGQIQKISSEIAGELQFDDSSSSVVVLNESDLSLKKLEEYQVELQRLHNEKIDRINKVDYHIDTVLRLSATLGMDSSSIIKKVHPSLNDGTSKNISNCILAKLNNTVESLEEEKKQRLEKFHQLGRALANLWDLMDTSDKDRRPFSHVICLLPLSSSQVSDPGLLAANIVQQAEAEVRRLDQLKASRMKELFFKKQNELEAICNKSHIEIPSQTKMQSIIHLINSGEIDHANLLLSMDERISRATEEACSRKSIMEKVEKWMLARDEERWLEEYNMDQNRYSVSRGAHKNLRRAERARLTVNKIPALVDLLVVKTKSWEKERNKVFLYDEVPLLKMLADYNEGRQEKDEEKRRLRDKKKVQGQGVMEAENYSGSGASASNRRLPNAIADGSLRRSFVGTHPLGCNVLKSPAPAATSFSKDEKMNRTFGSHLRDETASVVSTFSGPLSP